MRYDETRKKKRRSIQFINENEDTFLENRTYNEIEIIDDKDKNIRFNEKIDITDIYICINNCLISFYKVFGKKK